MYDIILDDNSWFWIKFWSMITRENSCVTIVIVLQTLFYIIIKKTQTAKQIKNIHNGKDCI